MPFFEHHADQVHPVVRQIIGGAANYSAADLFQATDGCGAAQRPLRVWERGRRHWWCPLHPTATRSPKCSAEPFLNQSRLGYYTNFVNLLDLAAIAVPSVDAR